MEKKRLYVDMDGVLVDLSSEIDYYFTQHPSHLEYFKDTPDGIPGIFLQPKPIKDSIESIFRLHNSGKYDIFIATASPWNNHMAASHKLDWLQKYFGDLFYKKVFITHRKDLLIGDYLIDDRLANGAGEFKGELIRFGTDIDTGEFNKFKDWNSVLNYLMNK